MTPDLFNRARRISIRSRALAMTAQGIALDDRNAEELIDRLSFVRRDFSTALIIGDRQNRLRDQLSSRSIAVTLFDLVAKPGSGVIVGEEDRLPFGTAQFDLILANGLLDSVNDLPGALLLIQRALRPGGLFLGALAGGGSLPGLRELFGSLMGSGAVAARQHLHPQIDIRSAGDLLVRAQFSLPVVDQDDVAVPYETFPALLHDLRANGLSNALNAVTPMTRAEYKAIKSGYSTGPKTETFSTIFLTGWAPQSGDPVQDGPKLGL
jgi:NADH dehydrogenase [ubiquinone] 1 alpha subcomplex assembly factor 5